MDARHEKIFKRDDGSLVKVEVELLTYDSYTSHEIVVFIYEDKKWVFVKSFFHELYVTMSEIQETKLELLEKAKDENNKTTKEQESCPMCGAPVDEDWDHEGHLGEWVPIKPGCKLPSLNVYSRVTFEFDDGSRYVKIVARGYLGDGRNVWVDKAGYIESTKPVAWRHDSGPYKGVN